MTYDLETLPLSKPTPAVIRGTSRGGWMYIARVFGRGRWSWSGGEKAVGRGWPGFKLVLTNFPRRRQPTPRVF